jgi:hypothetical protein
MKRRCNVGTERGGSGPESPATKRAGQAGMVLLSAMLILATVSFVAVGLSRDSITDYRLSHNLRLSQQQFYQAEAGLNLGVQVARDILLNLDDGVIDPAADYPGVEARIDLSGDESQFMGRFQLVYGPDDDLVPTGFLFELFPDSTSAQAHSRVEVDMVEVVDMDGSGGTSAFAIGYDSPWRGGGGGSSGGETYYTIRARATDERTGVQSRLSTVYAIID